MVFTYVLISSGNAQQSLKVEYSCLILQRNRNKPLLGKIHTWLEVSLQFLHLDVPVFQPPKLPVAAYTFLPAHVLSVNTVPVQMTSEQLALPFFVSPSKVN